MNITASQKQVKTGEIPAIVYDLAEGFIEISAFLVVDTQLKSNSYLWDKTYHYL